MIDEKKVREAIKALISTLEKFTESIDNFKGKYAIPLPDNQEDMQEVIKIISEEMDASKLEPDTKELFKIMIPALLSLALAPEKDTEGKPYIA